MRHLSQTQRPVTVTVTGEAAVLQDADAYHDLLDLAAAGGAVEGIRQGLEDVAS
jgi:hypothetical protein